MRYIIYIIFTFAYLGCTVDSLPPLVESSSGSTSGATSPATSSGETTAAPCETGIVDGTTGVEAFDDAYTFTIPLTDGLCIYPDTKYTATAWRVCGLMEPLCPVIYGDYFGQSFECEASGVYPDQVSVTVHSPGWYMPGLTEVRAVPIGEGEQFVTEYYCFDPVAEEVTEDDYNDVTERIMNEMLDQLGTTDCREYCTGSGGCQ